MVFTAAMSAVGYPLALAPVAAIGLLAVALRPVAAGTVAGRRLALVRAALVTGAFAVLTVELLGVLRLLTLPAFAVAWLTFLAGALAAVGWRRRRDEARGTAVVAAAHRAVEAVAAPEPALVGATAGPAVGAPPLLLRRRPPRAASHPATPAGGPGWLTPGVRRVGVNGCSPARSAGCCWSSC